MTRILLTTLLAASPALAVGVIPPIPRIPEKQLVPGAPPTDPDAPKPDPDDPATVLERITQTAEAVGDRLKDKDTGADTRQRQEQLLKDIDSLLKPPPPMDGGGGGGANDMNRNDPPPMPPPGGGMGEGNPPPMGGGSGRQRPPRGSRGEGQPMPMGGEPMPGSPMPKPMGGEPMGVGTKPGQPAGSNPGPGGGQKSPPALPLDVPITKEVWGHLPEKMRQEVSQYYREQYLPRYNELLKQYYTALAERERK